MSFIRPEARATLWRWREVLAGVALTPVGAWWSFGVTGWLGNAVGFAVLGIAMLLLMLGIQRARFREDSDGPGVVQVVEGRVAYFGPLTGGAVDMAEITRLSLDVRNRPATWVLVQPGVEPLHIPVTAKGAEALFDAFAALPGLRMEYMLRELNDATARETVIWQKGQTAPALH
ncbi:hypothetical protein PGB28_02385 [Primorskyibacter aestuariivivens]|uniref:hypothetical protein n=1 Tax=Primorskyibacter aestuariivivens TaxID=1888912 RepID=UPI0023014133|nr:hypothetical protein [Primorskyibacter aestuariivivens]MDA7427290.1 hypothetical protein [Primorskyibacter aestuariivivens]